MFVGGCFPNSYFDRSSSNAFGSHLYFSCSRANVPKIFRHLFSPALSLALPLGTMELEVLYYAALIVSVPFSLIDQIWIENPG